MSGPVPEWLVTASVAVTLFALMFSVGLGIAPGDLRWVWRQPGPMFRGLFAVLVAVPAVALAITRVLSLPRLVEVGIVLMSISPGAPAALRRSLDAGAHHAFAPSLQISSVMLAVISMPLTIAVLNQLYVASAEIAPWDVARQVFVAQLLPLGLGIALRHYGPSVGATIEPRLKRVAAVLLVATMVLMSINLWGIMATTRAHVLAAIALTTVAALAVGHLLGGPEPEMRTAVAIISAARNPGLALLVATQNQAPPAIVATILAYLAVSVVTIGPYVAWRRSRRERAPQAGPS